MDLLGLVFVGSATPDRPEMARFLGATLGLPQASGDAVADIFRLPDGSRFAVADEREPGGGTSRTVGFLVADLDSAVAELRAAGVGVAEPVQAGAERYAHFRAPDGELYELIQLPAGHPDRRPGRPLLRPLGRIEMEGGDRGQ